MILSIDSHLLVLIESDWNLKFLSLPPVTAAKSGINRIRLEFKVESPTPAV